MAKNKPIKQHYVPACYLREFVDPKSSLAKSVAKEYWVKEDREKPKFNATCVVEKVQEAGFKNFDMYQHTKFWRKCDGKNHQKGFGTFVVNYWYWYENWIDFIIRGLKK